MKHLTIKRLIVFSLLIFLFSGFSTCSKNQEAALLGCWTHSREESKEPALRTIFRPCDFKEFPPSRFRFKFELMSEGKCKILRVGPTDGHFDEEGTWAFDTKTNRLELIDAKGNSHITYDVLNFKEDFLELKPL